jgi:hypothetical protein
MLENITISVLLIVALLIAANFLSPVADGAKVRAGALNWSLASK